MAEEELIATGVAWFGAAGARGRRSKKKARGVGEMGARALPLRSPPRLLIALWAEKPKGAGVGLTVHRTPRPPRFTTRSNCTQLRRGNPNRPPGRSGSVRVPRHGSGGPRLRPCPVVRVGGQTDPATWRHVTDPQRAAARKLIRHAAWISLRPSNSLKGKTALCESGSS